MKTTENPTVLRLDRRADQVGLALEKPARTVRRFKIGERQLEYRPGGKGVVKVHATGGDLGFDAEMTVTVERMEGYFAAAKRAQG